MASSKSNVEFSKTSSKSNVEFSKTINSLEEAWRREYGELLYRLRRMFLGDYNFEIGLPRDRDALRISVPRNVELSIEDVIQEKEKP
jgi:hypothetical protein